ncbi:MAG: hypothetical protein R3332_13385 [Pseudohongiellaceae bacterium]|nr:hypothetical protein [Pseudohongiellaceae bacterium]
MKRLLSSILFLASTASSFGHADSDDFSSACATLEFMAKMVTLNKMIPAHGDSYAEAENMLSQLSELNTRTCQSAILTANTRYGPSYDNGALISNDLYNSAWYFPNGQVFMAAPGHDVTIFYPNGRPMAYHWTHSGEPVFWPNGNLATPRFRYSDVTWYYPDGNVVTYEAGYAGGRWFYPFQRFDGGVGQQLLSSNWGVEDEHFYYLNFASDGASYLSRERIRRKLALSDYDLLDVPGVLLLITRLYQLNDEARQFTPADTNITGAPY